MFCALAGSTHAGGGAQKSVVGIAKCPRARVRTHFELPLFVIYAAAAAAVFGIRKNCAARLSIMCFRGAAGAKWKHSYLISRGCTLFDLTSPFHARAPHFSPPRCWRRDQLYFNFLIKSNCRPHNTLLLCDTRAARRECCARSHENTSIYFYTHQELKVHCGYLSLAMRISRWSHPGKFL